MTDLSDGAKVLMRYLAELNYRPGDYLSAGRLFYVFDNEFNKKCSVDELLGNGLIALAPNGAIGITPAGELWTRAAGYGKVDVGK